MEAFKPGDKVRRIGCDWEDIKVGDVRVVKCCVDSFSKPSVMFEGSMKYYDVTKFELVQEGEVVTSEMQTMPTAQPFSYPETDEDRDRAARAKLRAYKRGMRDWLYGTTSEEQS